MIPQGRLRNHGRMGMATFPEFFKTATGCEPYPYQTEFATREELPSLVSVPTGCGKTAAVALGRVRGFRGRDWEPCVSNSSRKSTGAGSRR